MTPRVAVELSPDELLMFWSFQEKMVQVTLAEAEKKKLSSPIVLQGLQVIGHQVRALGAMRNESAMTVTQLAFGRLAVVLHLVSLISHELVYGTQPPEEQCRLDKALVVGLQVLVAVSPFASNVVTTSVWEQLRSIRSIQNDVQQLRSSLE
ncbi:MAG: uncharacterized protein KVP18_000807 [Porospora cf. gigantea A]|uniref:uncharacterized protein n=1 Tax=Porospora cf. gigantea A TaxID=2853593 RepID=UPI00355A21B7|nr:MAG: hypothetical protein KVP18_000807 [Porospora cf. gigantea A]